MSDIRHESARIAALSRSRKPDDAELVQARQNLVAARLTRHVITEAATLRDEQRAAIAELLRAGGAA